MRNAQGFRYRGVSVLIEFDVRGARNWAIMPEGLPQQFGRVRREPNCSSFRAATSAAAAAVDVCLGTERPQGASFVLEDA